MARLTRTVAVDGTVDRCFAFVTTPPAPPSGFVVSLGGRRVEYRDATLEVIVTDPGRHRAVLRAEATTCDGDGRVLATVAAVVRASVRGATIDLVTDLVAVGTGADVARALLPDVGRHLLAGLDRDLPGPAVHPPATGTLADVPAGPAPSRAAWRVGLLVAAGVGVLAAAAAARAVVHRQVCSGKSEAVLVPSAAIRRRRSTGSLPGPGT